MDWYLRKKKILGTVGQNSL